MDEAEDISELLCRRRNLCQLESNPVPPSLELCHLILRIQRLQAYFGIMPTSTMLKSGHGLQNRDLFILFPLDDVCRAMMDGRKERA